MKTIRRWGCAAFVAMAAAALFCACATPPPPEEDAAADTGYTPIRSELLFSARYFEDVETLSVVLRSGDALDYHQVPRALFDQLLAAEDKDAFYRDHVQGKFGEKKIEF